MKKNSPLLIFLILILVTMLGPVGMNLLVPSMPNLAKDLGTDYGIVQLSLTVYLIGLAVGQLIYGPLSDRFGRRPVLITGVALFVLGSSATAFAQTIEFVILGRLAQALGGSAGMVVGRAMVLDVYGPERSASMLAYITMAMVAAPAVSPAIGGLIDLYFGWRAIGLAATLLGLTVFILCLTMAETNRTPIARINVRMTLRIFARLARSPEYMGYTLSTALSAGAFYTFVAGVPYVVINLMGASALDYGTYFVLVSIGYSSGSLVAARGSQKFGIDNMILVGIAIAFIGTGMLVTAYLSMPLALFALFGPMAIISFGNGISQPNGMMGGIAVAPQTAGAASGLLGFLQMAIGSAFAQLIGGILTASALPLIIVMTAATIFSLIAFLPVLWAHRRADPAQ